MKTFTAAFFSEWKFVLLLQSATGKSSKLKFIKLQHLCYIFITQSNFIILIFIDFIFAPLGAYFIILGGTFCWFQPVLSSGNDQQTRSYLNSQGYVVERKFGKIKNLCASFIFLWNCSPNCMKIAERKFFRKNSVVGFI